MGRVQKEIREELAAKQELLKEVRRIEKEKGMVTLVYSARDMEHNNAVALRAVFEK